MKNKIIFKKKFWNVYTSHITMIWNLKRAKEVIFTICISSNNIHENNFIFLKEEKMPVSSIINLCTNKSDSLKFISECLTQCSLNIRNLSVPEGLQSLSEKNLYIDNMWPLLYFFKKYYKWTVFFPQILIIKLVSLQRNTDGMFVYMSKKCIKTK